MNLAVNSQIGAALERFRASFANVGTVSAMASNQVAVEAVSRREAIIAKRAQVRFLPRVGQGMFL